LAVRLAIVVVVFAVETLTASLSVGTATGSAAVLAAVGVIAVRTAIMVVVLAVKAETASLFAADMAAAAVAAAVRVGAICLAVVIVVLAVKALGRSLSALAPQAGAWILLAVLVVAVHLAIVVVVLAIEAKAAVLLVGTAVGFALATGGHTRRRTPATVVPVEHVSVLDLSGAPATLTIALVTVRLLRARVVLVRAVQVGVVVAGVDVAAGGFGAFTVEMFELAKGLAVLAKDSTAAAREERHECGCTFGGALLGHVLAVLVAAATVVNEGQEFATCGRALVVIMAVGTSLGDGTPLAERMIGAAGVLGDVDGFETLGHALIARSLRVVAAVTCDAVHFATGHMSLACVEQWGEERQTHL